MAGSTTEVQSHDEGSDGRSINGTHGSVMGKEQNCNWQDGNATSKRESLAGAWLHSLLECILGMGREL